MNNKNKNIRRIIEIAVLVGFSCFLFLSCHKDSAKDELVIHSGGGEIGENEIRQNGKEPDTQSVSEEKTVGNTTGENTAGNTSGEKPENTGTMVVYVCGAVKNPGVYELSEGSRIVDAVEKAGGFSDDANREYVNLADSVSDGQMIRIPDSSEDVSLLPSASGEEDSFLVNINTASKEGLCEIPGVGEVRAEAILKYRNENGPFQTTEDLMKVPGIKEGTYNKIKDYVKVK